MTRFDFVAIYLLIGLGHAAANYVASGKPRKSLPSTIAFMLSTACWPFFLSFGVTSYLIDVNRALGAEKKDAG